jgi:hypothetical protein
MKIPENFALGEAVIQPDHPVAAGLFTTITFSYTAGHPIDDSGYVKITFRSVSDFGEPQFEDPCASNYCTIQTTGDCRIEPRWDPKGHTRPWARALFLKIRNGFLDTGEEIIVVFGDSSRGSPGWQMQTFCEEKFEFKTFVDPIATYQFKQLPISPSIPIVPGVPIKAICIAPSMVRMNEEFSYYLKLEDRWGNPTEKPQKIVHPGFFTAGVQTVTAMDMETDLSAHSNPIKVLSEEMPLRPYWADFHGQTGETVGTGTIEGYFNFARVYGMLDIVAHQGNDFQVTDAFWEHINRMTKSTYEPGTFVTFPGYEWSGNTPLGGDRNIYFISEGGRISRSCRDLIPGNHSIHEDSPNAMQLFKNLKVQSGPKSFAFAHVGGRYADISMHDPEIELAVEVHSAWGTFEWLVEDALQLGYRIGICANSDGHKCRPGSSYPGAGEFGSLGGLTCVLAHRLDRESIYAALKARHFYATTGNRPLIDVKLSAGDARKAIMGDVIDITEGDIAVPHLHMRVVGTAAIESAEVRNGTNVIKTLRPFGWDDLGNRIKIIWSGAKVRGRDRMIRWDGGLRVLENVILDAVPVNFWNPNQHLERVGLDQILWKSSTTGGLSGVILTLETPYAGSLEIETPESTIECDISSLGLDPRMWEFDGLRKKIEVYRLPDRPLSNEFSFSLPITDLRRGDNAIYIRMMQEDGHMAWTSPIYLVYA